MGKMLFFMRLKFRMGWMVFLSLIFLAKIVDIYYGETHIFGMILTMVQEILYILNMRLPDPWRSWEAQRVEQPRKLLI